MRTLRNQLVNLAGVILLSACGFDDGSDKFPRSDGVANPIVTQAPGLDVMRTGGLQYDVAQFAYREREYFFEGTATSWANQADPPKEYRSRMIVWTPLDPGRFNGTTVVEWAHVSDFGQFELNIMINYLSPFLEDEGFAFALVSAEEGGICDLREEKCTSTSLKGADPGRYDRLHHPGDSYAFDIFNQAIQAIKYPSGVSPLGDIDTQFVIATGFQPSIEKWFPVGAMDPDSFNSVFGINGPMNEYLVNGADATAQIVDAFLIDAAASAAEPAEYRVPTIHHLDESAIRRQPTEDRANHITWEVVGAAHLDRWAGAHVRIPSMNSAVVLLSRAEEEQRRDALDNFGQLPDPTGGICAPGPRSGSLFPRRFTLNAALAALQNWLHTGVPAPSAARTQRVPEPPDSATMKLERGPLGNAIGGLRSPIIDVPLATYNGEACVQAGTTVNLSHETLAALYPTHRGYVTQLKAAVDAAVADGFLLCRDAATIMRKASISDNGRPGNYSALPQCISAQAQ